MGILHDYRCSCGKVSEHFVRPEETQVLCECGQMADRVILKAPSPDWLSLAQGDSASPEAIDKFEKMHKKQAAKENESLDNHGDYGPRPGA